MNIEHVTSPATVATDKGTIPRASTVGAEPATKSTSDLLQDLTSQVTALVHEEVELAKAEMSEKAKKLGIGAGMFGGAALCAVFSLAALIAAAIAAIGGLLPIWAAALIVGGVLAALAGVLALGGRSEVKQGSPPVPEEAINSSKEDVTWLKARVNSAKP